METFACYETEGGILGLADNLLASQGLCSMKLFCFVRRTVSMNFMLFMNISVLKRRRPHYEMISSNLPKSSSIVFLSLYYHYISRSYSYFHCSSCSQFVITMFHKYSSGFSSQNSPLMNKLTRHKNKVQSIPSAAPFLVHHNF